MRWAFKGYGKVDLNKIRATTATFSGDLVYVNHDLLNYIAYTKVDPDGYEYACDLFDFARNPALFDKLLSL